MGQIPRSIERISSIAILLPTYDWGTSALFLRVVVSVSNVSLSYPSRHYIITFQSLKSNDKFLMDIHLRTTGCRLPYGITQYHDLPGCHPTQANTPRLHLQRTSKFKHNVANFAKLYLIIIH